jgi:multisubunit Na+/H+ antiporter MnhG subunit
MVRTILGSALLVLGAVSIVLGVSNVGVISTASLSGFLFLLVGTPLVRSGLRSIRRAEEVRQRRPSTRVRQPDRYSTAPRDERTAERSAEPSSRYTARQMTIAIFVSVAASVIAAVIIKALDLS